MIQKASTSITYPEEQLASLFEMVDYAFRHSPFYREHLADCYKTGTQLSLEAFRKLPFTTKEHLAEQNDQFLAVPRERIAEYASTSGTTGDPVSVFLTKNDLERLAVNEYDSQKRMGGKPGDVFQLLTTMDKQFMAGLAYYLGVQRLGAGMVRMGPGLPRMQWQAIQAYRPNKLIAVPSFIVKLIDYAKEHHIDLNATNVESIVCIGEPIRNHDFTYNALGKRITSQWNVKLYSTYASTEMATAFSECGEGTGCHVNESLIFLEVIKEDGTAAEQGEVGEITVTPLKVEGTPLIRFRTGDLAHVYYDTCSCGSTAPRLGPIIGRRSQMIKLKGTTIYPKAIFDVLDGLEKIAFYKVEVRKDAFENDKVTVFLEESAAAAYTIEELSAAFRAKLRVIPGIVFVSAVTIKKMIFNEEKRKPEKISFH